MTHNTTVAVGLASQLNWILNPELMQRLTTSTNARVLLMSLNEFDDITTHGVGYETFVSDESENDGKHVAELLACIDEIGSKRKVTWADISHCFVSTENNRVYYLPSLTLKERIHLDRSLTAEDYAKILAICSEFFPFIVIDTPDIFLQEKNDLMSFVLQVSDILCFVMEADSHSTMHLYHFFDGIKDENGETPLDPNKCILLINKYVTKDNVYMTLAPEDQIPYENIAKGMSKYFARFICMPFTRPRAVGNIIAGTDPKVKQVFGDLADVVLELIDENDERERKKRKQYR